MADSVQAIFKCASKVIDVCHIALEIQRPWCHIFPSARGFVVYDNYMVAFFDQTVDEMGTDESSAARNQDVHALTCLAPDCVMSFDGLGNRFLFDDTHSQSWLIPVSLLT